MCCDCLLNCVIRYFCCDDELNRLSEAGKASKVETFENYQQPKKVKTEAFPYPPSYYTYRLDRHTGVAVKVEVPIYESKNLKNVDQPTIPAK